MSMEDYEKVEKLREKAEVTYEEAKEALENNNWDMLEAMVYLEKQGKVKGPQHSQYSTNDGMNQNVNQQGSTQYSNKATDSGFGDMLGRFFAWCGRIIKKGNENYFCIERNQDSPVRIPVTVFVLLLVIAFWVVVPLIIIGLFFGFQYSFQGADLGRQNVNDFMDKASHKASDIKDEFVNGYNGKKDEK